MTFDPQFLVAIGDVLLNLSAGWFGAAIIIPGTGDRKGEANTFFIAMNLFAGFVTLALGYKLRIMGL